jgi:hypothetical protein
VTHTRNAPTAIVPAIVGVLLTSLVLALGLSVPSASAASAHVCSDQTTSALCLDYSYAVYQAGTSTETTVSRKPVDLRLGFQNTSSNYVNEAGRPRWLDKLTAKFPASLITKGTAQLPDELLVAGVPTSGSCGPGADFSFSGCTAGHGVGYVYNVLGGLLCSSPCKLTFGIQRLVSDRDGLGGNLAKFRGVLDACIDTNGGAMSCDQQQTITQNVLIPQPTNGTLALSLTIPPSDQYDDLTIDQAAISLNGTSTRLADGSTVAKQTYAQLPGTCGPVAVSGTVASNDGTTVSASIPFTVTGCTALSAVAAKTTLVYGGSTTIAGKLTDTVHQTAISGASIVLRTCPVGGSCSTRTTTTSGSGGYSFGVKPARNTSYTISYPGTATLATASQTRTIKVAPKVTVAASRTTMPSGGTLKLTGKVAPSHAGKTVLIQRKVSGVWKTIVKATLNSSSAYAKSFSLSGAKGSKAALRVVLPAHTDHLAGVSPTVFVTFG